MKVSVIIMMICANDVNASLLGGLVCFYKRKPMLSISRNFGSRNGNTEGEHSVLCSFVFVEEMFR